MTDLTPNDLSHLSDEEFNALCLRQNLYTRESMTDFRALCAELVDALDQCQRLCGDQPESFLVWKANAALAQPEPQGPAAWMYRGEPDFDGKNWRENWEVTLNEKLARFKSDGKDPVPLWNSPAKPEPQGPTEAQLKTFACEWWHAFGFAKDKATCTWVIDHVAPEHFADFSRDVLARWGK